MLEYLTGDHPMYQLSLIVLASVLLAIAGKPFLEECREKLRTHAARQLASTAAAQHLPWDALQFTVDPYATLSGATDAFVTATMRVTNTSDRAIWLDDVLVRLSADAARGHVPDGRPKQIDSIGCVDAGQTKDFAVTWSTTELAPLYLPFRVRVYPLKAHLHKQAQQAVAEPTGPMTDDPIAGHITDIDRA